MRTVTFNIDYEYCPKGHTWDFIGSSTLYPDVFWCEQCDCFYSPSVRKVKRGEINKSFSSDREAELIGLAEFKRWLKTLSRKDMPKSNAASG